MAVVEWEGLCVVQAKLQRPHESEVSFWLVELGETFKTCLCLAIAKSTSCGMFHTVKLLTCCMTSQHGQSPKRLHALIVVWACDAIEQVSDNIIIVHSAFAEDLGCNLLDRKAWVSQQSVKCLQLQRILGILSDVPRLWMRWRDDASVAHDCETSDDGAHNTEACDSDTDKHDSLVPRERDELVGPSHRARG
jgi:hypothetical protein